MGKLFSSNSWRAPLQLIDCWLPLPTPRHERTQLVSGVPRAVQRFARAGWLNRESSRDARTALRTAEPHSAMTPACRVHVFRPPETRLLKRPDTRLVISGSIGEVCAELERLAAMEQESSARAA